MEAVAPKVAKKDFQADDQRLIFQAIEGNQQAFTCLMERYQHSVNRTIRKMVASKEDAEDLTLEAFGKAFHNLGSYRPHYAFSTWLFRIAINHCIDYLRKKRLPCLPIDLSPDGNFGEDFSHALPSNTLDPEEIIIREQRLELMRTLMHRLSRRNRLILEMHYFEGLSYEEISREMGVPIGTVKAQLHRAREAMSAMIIKTGAGLGLVSKDRSLPPA